MLTLQYLCLIGSVLFIERSWLEQGRKIGEEQVVPLARNFNGMDIESGSNYRVCSRHTFKKWKQYDLHCFLSCIIYYIQFNLMDFLVVMYDIWNYFFLAL